MIDLLDYDFSLSCCLIGTSVIYSWQVFLTKSEAKMGPFKTKRPQLMMEVYVISDGNR
jgi:hypothetical protein